MDRQRGTLEARILYWGPPASGKTETLGALQRAVDPEGRSTLFRLASEDGSTVFFDILTLEEFRYGGQRIRVSVCAAPGGIDRAAERAALLRGADGVVFVADSHRRALADNRICARELEDALNKLGRRGDVPIVWSFNKQDGEERIATRELREMLVPGPDPVYETVAPAGQGVFESFRESFRLLLQNLRREQGLRPEPEDRDGLPEQLLPQLARGNGRRGRPRTHDHPGVVRLTVAGEDDPDTERAVDTMLAMAQRQAEQGERMRLVEARNNELMAVNRVARSILSAMEIDNLLVVLLDATAERLAATHAGVVMFDPTRDGALRTHVTGFGKDPALGLEPVAARRFFDVMRESDGPIPADAARNPDLFDALLEVDRRIQGAIFQPIKLGATTPSGWIGIYFMEEGWRIGAQGLLFLSSISRLAALGLEKIAQFDAMTRLQEKGDAERRELAARLEMAQARAKTDDRDIDAIVGERTHELREELHRVRVEAATSAEGARRRGAAELASAFAREVHKPVTELAGRLQDLRDRIDNLRRRGDAPDTALAGIDAVLEGCLRSTERVDAVAASLGRMGATDRDAGEQPSLNAAVADAVTLLGRRIEGCAELELRLGKVAPLAGDGVDLDQVVVALLTNALEAVERSGSRGRIIVTTFADAARATLRVTDDGPGIDPELLPNVCEPFVTTKDDRGAGLGLHAARAALDAQGGELRLNSRAGDGTSVMACFPLAVSARAAQTASSRDAAD